MERQAQPRAVYDKPSRGTSAGATPPRPQALPPGIAESDPSVQLAYLVQQAGQQPEAEIDEERYARCSASIDEVHELREIQASYQPLVGREPVYAGRELFSLVLPDDEAVRSAFTVVRCEKYATACNAEAWELAEQKAQARQRAEAAVFAPVHEQNAQVATLATDLLNSGRSADGLLVQRPDRREVDYSAADAIQREIDRLGLQIDAAHRREKTARSVLGDALSELALAGATLTHVAPEVESNGWSALTEHRQARATIARRCGDEEGDRSWERFERRWRSDDGRSWKQR